MKTVADRVRNQKKELTEGEKMKKENSNEEQKYLEAAGFNTDRAKKERLEKTEPNQFVSDGMNKLDDIRKSAAAKDIKNLKAELKQKQEEDVWASILNASTKGGRPIEQWKQKYMYPFGDIAPIKDNSTYSKSTRALP